MTCVLSLGSINADFMVRVSEPPHGPGTIVGEDLLRTSGGKAANVAVAVARLGSPSMLLGCVGDDDLAAQALAGPIAAGVDTSAVRRRPGPTGYSQVTVPHDGDKTIVLALNANDAWADDAAALGEQLAAAPSGSVLVADLEVPYPVVEAGLRAARRQGLPTVLDPSPPSRVDDHLLAMVDHLTPDHREAAVLAGIPVEDVDDAARAATMLQERGAGTVHVKLPSGGCVTASGSDVTVVELTVADDAVDATGAGDAFAGALGWALLHGHPPVHAAELAVAAATCSVRTYGSQESYPSSAELHQVLARVVHSERGPPRPR